MVFSQLLPLIALTRFLGVCFRSQRLRLARLMGEFSDGFLTVLAAMAMLYLILIPCRPAIYDIEIYDLSSTYVTRLNAGGVTKLLRQEDARVFKKYSQMKLQIWSVAKFGSGLESTERF